MPSLQQFYHALPHGARCAAASLRGYYLRRWRYGAETRGLVDAALARDRWDHDRWQEWRTARLNHILTRAARQVPYYRRYWRDRGKLGDPGWWLQLKHWPVMSKAEIRERPLDFLADDCDPNRMFRYHTSGTSGTPLSLYASRGTLRRRYALYEARIRQWNGVAIRQRWAIMGGQMVVPLRRRKPPYWVHNVGLNQLYMSTFHLVPETAADYVAALKRFGTTHMIVYPSSARVLAAAMLDQDLAPPRLAVVISNAEYLSTANRRLLERAFACPVRNTYGMAEFAAEASECEAGTMHLWPDAGVVEIFRDTIDESGPVGVAGRLIVTGLQNDDMPLIRYDVGDRGRLSEDEAVCACGRNLPVLAALEGRTNDMIVTPDGRHIFWLNPVFYDVNVAEAQIEQADRHTLIVRFVSTPDYTVTDGDRIRNRLRERVGDITIKLEQLKSIPRGPNGKFQAVISRVPVLSLSDQRHVDPLRDDARPGA